MTSPYKAIAEVRDLTGYCVRLGVFEEIVKVDLTDEIVEVVVRRFRVTEQRSQYRVKAEGLEQIKFTLKNGDWIRQSDIFWTTPDDEVMLRRDTTNVYESVKEYRDHRDFEVMCHRPGTSRTPLDSADASDSERMLKHWKLI